MANGLISGSGLGQREWREDAVWLGDDGVTEMMRLAKDTGNLAVNGVVTSAGAVDNNGNITITNTAPFLLLSDSTGSAKSLKIKADANKAQLRETAGADGSLLVLDLANNRAGVCNATPSATLDVTGTAAISGALTAGSLNSSGASLVHLTMASATPGAVRSLFGQMTTFTSMTSGTLMGLRGETDIAPSCAVSGTTFLYGAEGKVVLGSGSSVDVGSGYVCGAIGQLDVSAGTITSGHVAPLIASLQAGATLLNPNINAIYAEVPPYGSGGGANSFLQGFGSVSAGLDFSAMSAPALVALSDGAQSPYSSGAPSVAAGKIAVKIGSSIMYLEVYSA